VTPGEAENESSLERSKLDGVLDVAIDDIPLCSLTPDREKDKGAESASFSSLLPRARWTGDAWENSNQPPGEGTVRRPDDWLGSN
jgi:hypothetical protein